MKPRCSSRISPGERVPTFAHVQLHTTARHLLETRRDGVSVRRPERGEGLQDHDVERPLQDVGIGRLFIRHANGIHLLYCDVK
jgi:hypothetical protein